MTPASERLGLAQMASAMVLSGTLGVFVLESGQSAWNVVFFRCLFGALSLFLYCWARGLLKPGLFTAKTLALTLVAGAALVMNWVLLFSAYRLASISLATAVYNVQPFFLIGLGVLFLGERPSRGKLAWSVVAFAGLLLVLRLTETHGAGGQTYLAGLLLGLGAAALYGVTAVIVKRLKGIPPQVLALSQVTLGAVMLLPMADFNALPAAPLRWAYLVALGLVHTCLMYILMYSAIQKLPTTSTAALSFIYPAVAIMLDLLVYGHRMEPVQVLGVAMIFVAAAGVSLNWTWRLPGRRPRAV
ncbi:DMT family transporter [Achromobacter piechaudii]|uniref:EamA domain-containing protein n=1 Tax=Achromobacter piechaudii TaxID=72556 RepID=A0A6S7DTZ9_9BURK|nr:DMT family transporter [Achromobacter piechaudii]CAB3861193.1 hypothetical protein LMG1861_02269 [Achromobacter piechaudii]